MSNCYQGWQLIHGVDSLPVLKSAHSVPQFMELFSFITLMENLDSKNSVSIVKCMKFMDYDVQSWWSQIKMTVVTSIYKCGVSI